MANEKYLKILHEISHQFNEEHMRILEKGVDEWNKWRRKEPRLRPAIDRANLEGANLSGIDFRDTTLKNANLSGVTLIDANLKNAEFGGAWFWGYVKRGRGQIDIAEANFEGANLEGANLDGADLRGTNFIRAKLAGAKLAGATLNGTDLRGATLSGSNLEGAVVKGTNVDATTVFDDGSGVEPTNVHRCTIDAYALDSMDRFGGLTPRQRASMFIVNDLADLRATYSGLQLWIHILSLCAFLFPYLWFLTVRYSEARFTETDETKPITLWEALSRYIWNGGQGWRDGWELDQWSFAAFVFLAIYNLLRGLLLWKTNKLEHREQITKIPVRFSLSIEPFWRLLVIAMSVLFWISLGVLTYNTYHFMSQKVPTVPATQAQISVQQS